MWYKIIIDIILYLDDITDTDTSIHKLYTKPIGLALPLQDLLLLCNKSQFSVKSEDILLLLELGLLEHY